MVTGIDPEKLGEVKKSDEYWVVDFWAEWCGPCKKLAPVFEDVSEEMDHNFGKVDMEEHGDIGTEFGVRALPTLLILKDGEEVARTSGALNKERLTEWIEDNT